MVTTSRNNARFIGDGKICGLSHVLNSISLLKKKRRLRDSNSREETPCTQQAHALTTWPKRLVARPIFIQ